MIYLDDDTGKIEVWSDYVNEELNDAFMSQFAVQQEYIKLFGKTIAQPRLSRLFGDDNVNYKYSGQLFSAAAWTPFLSTIKNRLLNDFGYEFNSALVNYYRNGTDSMGLHADNEKELKENPTIASLSLGETRKMVFRSQTDARKIEIEIKHGDLLLMSGALQHCWKHEIPKSKRQHNVRLNFTFRRVFE